MIQRRRPRWSGLILRELDRACRTRGRSAGSTAVPWILLLGFEDARAMLTLIWAGRELHPIIAALPAAESEPRCRFWLADDAMFIEAEPDAEPADDCSAGWRSLLQLLRGQRRHSIDAVVVALDVAALLEQQPTKLEQRARHLRQQLDALRRTTEQHCPLHIVVSRCELLDGFVPLLRSLPTAERLAACGFSLQPQRSCDRLLVNTFHAGYQQLQAALLERRSYRLLEALDHVERESLLCLPEELLALRSGLWAFLESLTSTSSSSDCPWLSAVYLVSGEQRELPLSLVRQQRLRRLALTPDLPAVNDSDNSPYFLSGLFRHLISQAALRAQPSTEKQRRLRRRQQLAVALAGLLCLASTYLLCSHYGEERERLVQLVASVQRMVAAPPLRAPQHVVLQRDEAARERAVLNRLAMAQRGSLLKPYSLGAALLRRRIEASFMAPLQQALEADLQLAVRQESIAPGSEWARGFRALKASFLLAGRECQGVDHKQAKQSLRDDLVEYWRRGAGNEATTALHISEDSEESGFLSDLRRLSDFYSDPLAASQPLVTRFRANPALERQVQQALLSLGAAAPELLIRGQAATAQLVSRRPQLGNAVVEDSGIESVFTESGCNQLFANLRRGEEWWPCLLGVPMPKESHAVAESYQKSFIEAWNRWLSELKLRRPESEGGDLATTLQLLHGLLQPHGALTEVGRVIGRGRPPLPPPLEPMRDAGALASCAFNYLRRPVLHAEQSLSQAIRHPACQRSQRLLEPLALFAGPPQKAPEGTSSDLADRYGDYRQAAQRLRALLLKLEQASSNSRPALALKLVQATMAGAAELAALDAAQRALMHELTDQLQPLGFELGSSGLQRILLTVESSAWRALLPLAAQSLDAQWRLRIFDKWQRMLALQLRQKIDRLERCKQRSQFLQRELEPFIVELLQPLHEGSPHDCRPGKMSPPFSEPLAILPERCQQLMQALADAESSCESAIGATATASQRDPIAGDIQPPSDPSCQVQGEEVLYDSGSKLFRCPVSRRTCSERQGLPSSKQLRLLFKWKDRTEIHKLLEAERPSELLRHGQHVDGWLVFEIPKAMAPQSCSGYRLRLRFAPELAGPAVIPVDNSWDRSNLLPASLLR